MAQDDDSESQSELVERVLRRVVRELSLNMDLDDLRGWGHAGLLEAKRRFDPSRGVRFSTFAYYRVRGAMLDGIRDQSWIRRSAYAKLKAIEAGDALCAEHAEAHASGPAPSLSQRASAIDDILGKVSAAYVLASVGQSELEVHDTPETQLVGEQQRSVVKQSLEVLPEKERALIEAVYFEGSTIEEAGARLGLSKSWASRMHGKALERMKKRVGQLA